MDFLVRSVSGFLDETMDQVFGNRVSDPGHQFHPDPQSWVGGMIRGQAQGGNDQATSSVTHLF